VPRSRAYCHREPSFGVGALAGPEPFARPEPVRGSAAIRLRSLWPIRSRCTLCPQRPLEVNPHGDHWNRALACGAVTPLGVLDADPPRLVVYSTAGGAFTEIVPSSDVPCRPRAPSHRFQTDRQLPPHARSREHEDGFTRLTRIVPPSSPEGELLPPLRERMEERPKTPSVVSSVL
jgi:hypothetical protein